MRIFSYLNSIVFSFAVLLLTFGVLTYLKVPVGQFNDWVAGLLAFFWLVTIVTVPWNIHFKAKAVLADAVSTRERGLTVEPRQVAYVSRLSRASLWAAIALHVGSAVVLFVLAVTGVTRVGYIASVLALLLTALRPAASAYEYLAERLRTIGETWKYPREDVLELRGRVDTIEADIKQIKTEFDPEPPESLLSVQRANATQTRQDLANVTADLDTLRAKNDNDHERLSQETRSAISQLSTDGQFLEHVREILRFFKTA